MIIQDVLAKIPPQSIEAEAAILGAMLIEEEAVNKAVELIDSDAFYDEKNKKVFNGIVALYEKSRAIDTITLTEQLEKNGDLAAIGGPAYIAALTEGVPTAANIGHYLNIIKEKFILRSLLKTASQITKECYESGDNVDYLLDKAEQMIFKIAEEKITNSSVSLKDIIKDSIETIDNLYQRKEQVTGLATGYHDFDIMTAGMQPSDLVILAARPSMGKSALAACIAEHVAVVGKKPIAFFSLEMSKESLVQRLLCSHAKVDLHKVRTGFLAQADWPKLVNAAGKLSEAPFFIDDTPGISVLELRAKARRLKAQHDIQLIVLDYLQLMQGHKRAESRQPEITEISRSLKALARELKVPVIALSQLS
ncbi:MAG: replicative DNA helicase, partial [Candidatus Omnitrophica bacterium]|nr:replicative DNA helicase [Candidatus Omnitrophota bacterium]